MVKKSQVTTLEKGVGFVQGFVTNLMDVIREHEFSFDVIHRLVTPQGRATVEKMVLLAHADWLSELGENEYLVFVSYEMPRDKATLEAEFSKGGVSRPFCDNSEWRPHSSCALIDQRPGERIMLVKDFGRNTTSKANNAEMDELGYRPATHLEAYAFAKNNPELQRQSWIVALGSSTMDDDNRRRVAMLGSHSGGRSLDDCWFGFKWYSDMRFLFVRK